MTSGPLAIGTEFQEHEAATTLELALLSCLMNPSVLQWAPVSQAPRKTYLSQFICIVPSFDNMLKFATAAATKIKKKYKA